MGDTSEVVSDAEAGELMSDAFDPMVAKGKEEAFPSTQYMPGTSQNLIDELMADGDDLLEEVKEEAAEPEVKEETSEAEPAEKTEESEEKEEEAQNFKAKVGDEEVDISPDAVFKVKIDGKEEEVTLKDALRNFQGKVPWEKHYKELKEEKVAFDGEKETFETEKQKFADDKQVVDAEFGRLISLAEVEPVAAIEQMAVLAGHKDVKEFWADFHEKIATFAQEFDNLTEPERDQYFEQKRRVAELSKREAELERREKGYEEAEAEKKKAAADKQLFDKIEGVKKEHSITEAELSSALDFLEQMHKDPKVKFDLDKIEKMERVDLTVDYILNVDRPVVRLRNLTNTISPDLAKDSKFIYELKGMTSTNMSDSDIIDIVKGFLGDEAKEPVEAKSEDSSKESPTKATSKKIPQRKKTAVAKVVEEDDDDILDLDDLVKSYK